MRPLHPIGRQAFFLEKRMRLVEIAVFANLERQRAGDGFFALPKQDRMMAALLQRAKTDVRARFLSHLQAKSVHVKCARRPKIPYREFKMAQADDIERRMKVRLAEPA